MSKPTNPNLNAEQILAKLIGFNTTSVRPNRGLIDFVRDYLDGFGVASQIVAGEEQGKACLWATVGVTEKSGIALAGHTDTVPVEGQKWDSDPFVLTERDGIFYGRGTADMKGFIACALAFVPEFLAAKTGGCFHIALTHDEETDMSGAVRLTDTLKTQQVKPAWVWIGEPTGLTIVNQHKGVAAYRTNITGVSGHSGKPDKGLNALEMGNQFMNVIAEAAKQRKEKPFTPSVFEPPYTIFNLGVISGGTAENIIAEHCELLWQVRTHPGEMAQDVVDEIVRLASALLTPRFAAFAPQAGMKTCACFDIPPFLATANNVGEKILKKVLKCDETHAVGFGTEAGIFQKLGSDAIVCGPGFIDQAHQPNEFIDKNQLAACVDLLRAVLLSSTPH